MGLYNVDVLYRDAGSADGYSQIGVERARDGRADALIARPPPSLLKGLSGDKMLVSRSVKDGRLRAIGAVGPGGYGHVAHDGTARGDMPAPTYVEFEATCVTDEQRDHIAEFRGHGMDWSGWYDSPDTDGRAIINVMAAIGGDARLLAACLLPLAVVGVQILRDSTPSPGMSSGNRKSARLCLADAWSFAVQAVAVLRRWGARQATGKELSAAVVALGLRETWMIERGHTVRRESLIALQMVKFIAHMCLAGENAGHAIYEAIDSMEALKIAVMPSPKDGTYWSSAAAKVLPRMGITDPLSASYVRSIIRKADLFFALIIFKWTATEDDQD